MPTFKVTGATRETAEDIEVNITADTIRDAEVIASSRQIMVSNIVEVKPLERVKYQKHIDNRHLQPGHDPAVPSININMPKRSSSFGIASLIIGILSLLIAFVPFIGILSIPIAAIALLLGGIGFLTSIFRQGAGFGYPIAGLSVSGIALFIGIFQVFVIGTAVTGFNEVREMETSMNAKQLGVASNSLTPDWIEYDQAAVIGDVVIKIESYEVGKVEYSLYSGDNYFGDDDRLKIYVKVTNSSETIKFEYASWGRSSSFSDDRVTLTDNYGNEYDSKDVSSFSSEIVGRTSYESIYPGKSISDILIFEPPIDKAEYLLLELSGSVVGETGVIRFRLPWE